MADGKATTIRFAEKIYARLEKASEATGLPINSVVVVAVLDWLESHPPELAGRGTRGFDLERAEIAPLPRAFGRRVERRFLPWPASPRAFDQFSRTAQSALVAAQREAESRGAEYIGTGHLLAALRSHGLAQRLLMRLDVTQVAIQGLFGPPEPEPAAHPATLLLPSTRVKSVLRIGLEEADRDGLQYVGTEHLLLAIVLEGESAAARFLAERGVTESRVREEVERLRAQEEA